MPDLDQAGEARTFARFTLSAPSPFAPASGQPEVFGASGRRKCRILRCLPWSALPSTHGHGSKPRIRSEHPNPQSSPLKKVLKWVVHLPQNVTIGVDPRPNGLGRALPGCLRCFCGAAEANRAGAMDLSEALL